MPTNLDAEETSHTEIVMSTALEQLEAAALSLARSGPIKDRLADACRNHLALVNPEELPAALRADFHACHDALTRERPLPGEDAVRATVRKMSNQDADEVAAAMVRLFAALARAAQVETLLAMPEAVSDGARSNGAMPNGANGARAKPPKGVPDVISLYAAEA
ncbi:MAG: hypothetical protein E6K24_08045 [Gammaproteobacteria bacterium]|nr:MAG: hypothetical protein E6K24_08045 [Gammaproteobacteria bacterium]